MGGGLLVVDDLDDVGVACEQLLRLDLLVYHLLDDRVAPVLADHLQCELLTLRLYDEHLPHPALTDLTAYLVFHSSDLNVIVQDHRSIIIIGQKSMTDSVVLTASNNYTYLCAAINQARSL
jgi:hypothetical protein